MQGFLADFAERKSVGDVLDCGRVKGCARTGLVEVMDCTGDKYKEASSRLESLSLKPGVTDVVSVSKDINGSVEEGTSFPVRVFRRGFLLGFRGEAGGDPPDLRLSFA